METAAAPAPNAGALTRAEARGLFLGILALALALRLWGIGAHSLWADEISAVFVAREGETLGEFLRTVPEVIFDPPASLLLVRLVPVIGSPEVSLRLAMALVSLLTLWVIYRLARVVLSRGPALWAAFLWGVSPLILQYSWEVRPYALANLAVAATWLMFLKAHGQAKGRHWFAFAPLAALCLYTQYMTAFFLLPLGLWATGDLLVRGLRRGAEVASTLRPYALFAVASLGGALLFAPWIPSVLRARTLPHALHAPPPFSVLGEGAASILMYPVHVHIPYLFLGLRLFWAVAALGALGVVLLAIQRRWRLVTMTLTVAVTGPVLIVVMLRQSQMFFAARFMTIFVPIWCLWAGAAIAWGISVLPRHRGLRFGAILTLAVAWLYLISGSLGRFHAREVEDLRGVTRLIAARAGERPVAVVLDTSKERLLQTYLRMHGVQAPVAYVQRLAGVREALSDSSRPVFLVASGIPAGASVEVHRLRGLDVAVLEPRPERDFAAVIDAISEMTGTAAAGGGTYQQIMGRGDMLFALEDFEGALAAFRQAAATGTVIARTHERIGDALERLDRLPEALLERQRAVELEPGRPWYYLDVAMTHRAMGDEATAREWMIRGLATDPAEETLLMELGLSHLASGEFDAARQRLQPILSMTEVPNHWYFARPARDLMSAGQLDLAEQFLDAGDRLYPGNPDLAFQRGRLRERQQRHEEALAAYERARLPGTRNVEAEIRMASVLLGAMNDPPRARALLADAAERNPEHPWVHYLLASAAARLDDIDTAGQEIDEALRLGLTGREGLLLAINIAMRQSRWDVALERAQGLLAQSPADALTRFNAAQCLLALERPDEARTMYAPARGHPALQELGEAVRAFERELGLP